MTSKSKFRPSPALVIACVALFAALSGSAMAAKVAIRSAQIVDGTVRTVDLRDNAVNTFKVANGTITADDLATDSVGSDEIAKDAVKADEIAPEAVASSEVANQSLTQDDRPQLGRLQRAADRLGPRLGARHDHPGVEQHGGSRRAPTAASPSTARPARR